MNTNSITVINAKVFDGVDVLHKKNVVFKNGQITGIMNELPADTKLIDGQGCTLLPGLIDAHVHTSEDSLREAILFGITTELEMQGGG